MADGAPSNYYDPQHLRAVLARPDGHRAIIGGMWEEIGSLQFDFLVKNGVSPVDKVVDIGCGSFRAGMKLIPYLEPGGYFGIDLSEDILRAGYEREIEPAGLADRFPRSNWRQVSDFDVSGFGTKFDVALAQSVFTHLPLDHIKACLSALGPNMNPGGGFFFTYFDCPPWADWANPIKHEPGGRTTYPDRDPYHHRVADMLELCGPQWKPVWLGDWNHPRGQKIALLQRR